MSAAVDPGTLNFDCPAEGGGEVGIHLEGGKGSPTEVQVSQCWAFYVNKALYVTVRPLGP